MVFISFVAVYGIAGIKESFYIVLTFRDAYTNAKMHRLQHTYKVQRSNDIDQMTDQLCIIKKKKNKSFFFFF